MVQFLLDLSADATSFAGDGKTPLEARQICVSRCFKLSQCAIGLLLGLGLSRHFLGGEVS